MHDAIRLKFAINYRVIQHKLKKKSFKKILETKHNQKIKLQHGPRLLTKQKMNNIF